MKKPISVSVDPEYPLAYITYLRDAPLDGTLPLFRDPDGVVRDHTFREIRYMSTDVHIDVTPDDEIIGFEILSIDDADCVGVARDYARDNGLAFPDDIRAAAAGDPAA